MRSRERREEQGETWLSKQAVRTAHHKLGGNGGGSQGLTLAGSPPHRQCGTHSAELGKSESTVESVAVPTVKQSGAEADGRARQESQAGWCAP